MSQLKGGVQFIGPIAALAAAPGPLNVWTYNHSQGAKAKCIEVLNSEGQPFPPTVVRATQLSTSQVVVTNLSGGPIANATIRFEWDTYSPFSAAPLASSVGTIS